MAPSHCLNYYAIVNCSLKYSTNFSKFLTKNVYFHEDLFETRCAVAHGNSYLLYPQLGVHEHMTLQSFNTIYLPNSQAKYNENDNNDEDNF